jgi:uncharacterized protein involved in high-affinity Fe2+ transport
MVEDVANTGETQESGDYFVGFAQEEAEGLYAPTGAGNLEWQEPDEANCHIEIAVCDADDGRFIPELDIAVSVRQDGEAVTSFRPDFLWHPGLFHYGANITLPGDGVYTLVVAIDPPTFHRHDHDNGHRYVDPVEVTFENVSIETGQS